MSSTHVVGIADCVVCNDADAVLVTYALGSCIAVTVHDPIRHVAGLLHFMLPESTPSTERAEKNPYMFANTGVPLLFDRVFQLGADKRHLVIKLIGGAQVLDDSGYFNIGKRNHLMIRKILWKLGLGIQSEAVGGTVSRTIRLEVGTGKLWVREGANQGKELTATTFAMRGAS
jgi:chemotaxis protein CheD